MTTPASPRPPGHAAERSKRFLLAGVASCGIALLTELGTVALLAGVHSPLLLSLSTGAAAGIASFVFIVIMVKGWRSHEYALDYGEGRPPADLRPDDFPATRCEQELLVRRLESVQQGALTEDDQEEMYAFLKRRERVGNDALSIAISVQQFLVSYLDESDLPSIPAGSPRPAESSRGEDPIMRGSFRRLVEIRASEPGGEAPTDFRRGYRGVALELMAESSGYLGAWKCEQERIHELEAGR